MVFKMTLLFKVTECYDFSTLKCKVLLGLVVLFYSVQTSYFTFVDNLKIKIKIKHLYQKNHSMA